jgi:hypothetical protein
MRNSISQSDVRIGDLLNECRKLKFMLLKLRRSRIHINVFKKVLTALGSTILDDFWYMNVFSSGVSLGVST